MPGLTVWGGDGEPQLRVDRHRDKRRSGMKSSVIRPSSEKGAKGGGGSDPIEMRVALSEKQKAD